MAGETKTWVLTIALALGAILLGGGILFGALKSVGDSRRPPKAASASEKAARSSEAFEIKKTAPQWWESARPIYFDIPARVLIKLPEAGEKQARRVIGKAWAEFDRMGEIFNPFDPNTEVARLNQNPPSEWTDISHALYQTLKITQKLWTASNGRFDPTAFPLKQLWQEAEKTQQFPSGRQIKQTLRSTGFENVAIRADNGGQLRLKGPVVQFDFGGIAKGFALDQVRQQLRAIGVSDGLIQLGGEISAFGRKNHAPWRIGIQHPERMEALWGVLSSKADIRVSTSGNYRQPLKIQGQSVYHIFNPKTGQPVSETVLGVTTASFGGSHSNALLDAAATAITVMGAAEGLELAEKLGIEALILTRRGRHGVEEIMSPGFSEFYSRQEKNAEPGSGGA